MPTNVGVRSSLKYGHVGIIAVLLVPMAAVLLTTMAMFNTDHFFEFSEVGQVVQFKSLSFSKEAVFDAIANTRIQGYVEAEEEINGEEAASGERKSNGTNTDYSKLEQNPTTYKPKITNEDDAVKFLETMGAGSAQVIAIMANIKAESSWNPNEVYAGHKGITQWDSGRYANMINWCNQNGYDPSTIDGQLRYTWVEMNSDYYRRHMQNSSSMKNVPAQAKVGAAENFWETTDYLEATKNYALCYEVGITASTSSGIQGWDNRTKYAKEYSDKYYGGK